MRAASFTIWILCGLTLAACTNEVETGRASYADLCAGCHGTGGQGVGPGVLWPGFHATDLTRISARNGGVFPRERIIARIDNYAKGQAHDGTVPELWPLLDGRTVLVETGEGILTPTSEPMVALTAYLESIQR